MRRSISYSIVFVSITLFLLFLAINARNYEAFEDVEVEGQSAQGPPPGIFALATPQAPSLQIPKMVRTVLGPYMDPRICSLYLELRLKIIPTNSLTGSPTDPEAIQKTDKQLQLEIPGGPPPCPLPPLPSDTADPKIWLEYVNALPRNLFSRIAYTLEYCLKTLKDKEKEISAATTGATEGFQPLCPPTVADTRRAEKAAAAAAEKSASCVNPEELTPEQIGNQVQLVLQEIQATSLKEYKKPLNPGRIPELLKECEAVKQKLDGVKNQAQAGTLPYPQVAPTS